MEVCEQENIVLPHNLLNGEHCYLKFKKIINTAIELGGTVYEVAGASGLLSAGHFMELVFDEQVTQTKIFSEDMTVVTEVYVQFSENEELDRIFLYSDNADIDDRLKKEGKILEGKLVIPYEKLKTLHAKGYQCLYERAKEGEKDKAQIRYGHSFGKDQKMLSFHLWDDSFTFLGNGFNQALLVRTAFETVFVMPDLHAVKESIKTVHAENLIRENYDADFWMERIDLTDETVQMTVQECMTDIFGRYNEETYEKLPESYRRLLYQIAYIKKYYPKVYETVWSDTFKPDDEKIDMNFENEDVSVAITLNEWESYGVCRMKDGSIKRIPNTEYSYDTPLALKYKFRGYGNILNAGAAGSRMAMIMKDIIKSAELFWDVSVEKVSVTHIGYLPSHSIIETFIKRREKRAMEKGTFETDANLIAYREMPSENMDGYQVVEWAAQMAELPGYRYVDWITAIVNVYEKTDEKKCLKENEAGLIYYFSSNCLSMFLVRKDMDGTITVIDECELPNPEDSIYDWELLEVDEYNPNLDMVLEDDMEEFMLNAGLGALGIYGDNQMDREAFGELRHSTSRVKRQFRRNDKAKLFFNNGYLSMVENYPIERFEACFQPILKDSEEHLQGMIKKAKLAGKEIAKVFLAGEETEYPFIKEHVKRIVKKEVYSINAPICAVARGAVLM